MKKFLAILLSALMIITALNVTPAYAAFEVASGTCGDGVLWSLDNYGLLMIYGEGAMDEFTWNTQPWEGREEFIRTAVVAEGVTYISGRSFHDCLNMTSIDIADSVTAIGVRAFEGCESLNNVVLPEGMITLNDYAFNYCSSLRNINIPNSVTTIGAYAFRGCSSLISFRIPEGIKSIGDRTLAENSGLTSIEIPVSLTNMRYGVGEDSPNIHDIYYLGSKEQWDSINISYGNSNITNATIHYNTPMFDDVIVTGIDEDEKALYTDGVNATGHKSIYWASSNGITKGYADGTFRPTADVTRQEMVLFLYRLAGKPSVNTSKALTFNDTDSVTGGAKKAIQWAVQAGITKGYSDGSFKPEQACTRAEIAIFLYRLARLQGREDTKKGSKTSFTDLGSCSKGALQAIDWATEEGIIKGYSGDRKGQFGPEDNCNRQQMAIMMMRYAGAE